MAERHPFRLQSLTSNYVLYILAAGFLDAYEEGSQNINIPATPELGSPISIPSLSLSPSFGLRSELNSRIVKRMGRRKRREKGAILIPSPLLSSPLHCFYTVQRFPSHLSSPPPLSTDGKILFSGGDVEKNLLPVKTGCNGMEDGRGGFSRHSGGAQVLHQFQR